MWSAQLNNLYHVFNFSSFFVLFVYVFGISAVQIEEGGGREIEKRNVGFVSFYPEQTYAHTYTFTLNRLPVCLKFRVFFCSFGTEVCRVRNWFATRRANHLLSSIWIHAYKCCRSTFFFLLLCVHLNSLNAIFHRYVDVTLLWKWVCVLARETIEHACNNQQHLQTTGYYSLSNN